MASERPWPLVVTAVAADEEAAARWRRARASEETLADFDQQAAALPQGETGWSAPQGDP